MLSDTIKSYIKNQESDRTEIIWGFLTVYRNINFNFSEYLSDYLPRIHIYIHMDSKIAKNN